MATASHGTWRTESSTGRQSIAAIVALAAGLGLAVALRHVASSDVTAKAGFALGCLLAVAGGGLLLFGGKQAVEVDPRARRVVLERSGRLGSRRLEIPFADIADVDLGENGDQEGGSVSYHVVLKLRSGKEVALFVGFFEGAHSRQAMEDRRRRLLGYLQP